MARPVILFSGSWTDTPLEELATAGRRVGLSGARLCCWGDHFEVQRALSEDDYCPQKLALLNRLDLSVPVLSAHRVSQAVCDVIDGRHRDLVPDYVWGDGAPGRRARAGRRGDAGHGAGRPEARRLRPRRLHRLADLVLRPRLSRAERRPSSRTPCATSPTSGTRSSMCARSAASATPSRCIPARSPSTCTAPSASSTPCTAARSSASRSTPAICTGRASIRSSSCAAFRDRIYHVHIKDLALTLNGRTSLLGSYLPLRRPAARLASAFAGPRRHRLGSDHPRPERHRLRGPAGGGVEGPGHGSRPSARRRRASSSNGSISSRRRAATSRCSIDSTLAEG